jgi:hypothetical protein
VNAWYWVLFFRQIVPYIFPFLPVFVKDLRVTFSSDPTVCICSKGILTYVQLYVRFYIKLSIFVIIILTLSFMHVIVYKITLFLNSSDKLKYSVWCKKHLRNSTSVCKCWFGFLIRSCPVTVPIVILFIPCVVCQVNTEYPCINYVDTYLSHSIGAVW